MKKQERNKIGYWIEVFVIGILIFSSISFILFYFPSRLFRCIDFYEIKIGIPFTFFHEHRITDNEVATSWNYYFLFVDYILSLILSLIFVKYLKFKYLYKNSIVKNLFVSTVYSILLFFSISLFQLLKIPIVQEHRYSIGFPFEYFKMFWLGGNYFPNHGSNPINLIINGLIFWLFCVFIIWFLKLMRGNKTKTLYQK